MTTIGVHRRTGQRGRTRDYFQIHALAKGAADVLRRVRLTLEITVKKILVVLRDRLQEVVAVLGGKLLHVARDRADLELGA